MKFVKTAVAVAIAGIASAPLVATATTTISGVVQVKVQDDDVDGSKVNFAAGDVRAAIGTEHELNSGLTGYGNLQLNLDDLTGQGGIAQDFATIGEDGAPLDPDNTANDRDPLNLSSPATVSADNVYVGVKGGFGDIRWGEIPLGVEYGQLANDIHDVGGTVAAGLSYTGAFGPVSFGLNYSPDADNNSDMVGVGAKFNYGGFTIGLGAEDRGELMNASVGTSFAFAGFSVGVQYWTMEQADSEGSAAVAAVAADPTATPPVEAVAAVAAVAGGSVGDSTNIALKLGYGIGDLSLGLTFSLLGADDGDGDEETVLRLDAGYDLGGGMDISTRINSTSTDVAAGGDDVDDVLYWRVMLTKNF